MALSRAFSLILFSCCCTSCFNEGEITGIGLIFFSWIIGMIVGLIWAVIKSNKQREREQKRQERDEQFKAKQRAEYEAQCLAYEESLKAVISKFGEADKTISLEPNDIDKEIRVYSSTRKVFILGQTYDFDSVLDCNIADNATVIKGQSTIISKGQSSTDTGNMLKRAVVGGVIGGGVGAAIGGSTAKRNTETKSTIDHGVDRTRHDMTVSISVKNISNPLIEIKVGNDTIKANEILALMKAIMAS